MKDCNCGCEESEFFKHLLKVYVWLLRRAYCLDKITKGEIKLMANYVVEADNPDVGFELILGEVKDSEGNVIENPQGLVTEILSTNDGVVQFIPGATDRTGQVKFGSPGQASLQYSVTDANGEVLGSGSDGFTVTTGDPSSIASIEATFEGLTPAEAPVAPPPTPDPDPAPAPEPTTDPVTEPDLGGPVEGEPGTGEPTTGEPTEEDPAPPSPNPGGFGS